MSCVVNYFRRLNAPYSIFERVLRTTVFQVAVQKGKLEGAILKVYAAMERCTLHPNVFSESRAARGRETWERLGADFDFVTPRDRLASIHRMYVKASALEEKINALGGSWDRMTLDDGSVILAIRPPEDADDRWESLEKDMLTLKWQKKSVTVGEESVEVIVTCANAASIEEEQMHTRLFLHANSASVSFIMLKRRAGHYLGWKQDFCFFDFRGTWESSGVASEAGSYNDIKVVYDEVREGYDAQNIWVTSACGGGGPAGYLLKEVHGSGVNFIRENGFTKLYSDFVDGQSWIARKFAYRYRKGLESRDIPESDRPQETGFDMKALWAGLEPTDLGKVVVVHPKNDQRLPGGISEKHLKRIRRVYSNVCEVTFTSRGKDPHSERYYESHNKAVGKVLEQIFA